MDERKEQLQVGAGLQESRLNTDLIQWLEKWSTPILMVVAVIGLGYVGMKELQKYQDKQIDSAFSAYEAARGTSGPDGILTGNPDSLVLVADEHKGKASIWELAKLDAADIWLGCSWRGLRPGTNLQDIQDTDKLTEEQIAGYLSNAKGQFDSVFDRVQGDDDLRAFELRSLEGLSAVALSEGDRDGARGLLERLEERAGDDYPQIAKTARRSIEQMDSLPLDIGIIAEADVPASANAPISVGNQSPQLNPLPQGFDPSLILDPNAGDEDLETDGSGDDPSDDGTDG